MSYINTAAFILREKYNSDMSLQKKQHDAKQVTWKQVTVCRNCETVCELERKCKVFTNSN